MTRPAQPNQGELVLYLGPTRLVSINNRPSAAAHHRDHRRPRSEPQLLVVVDGEQPSRAMARASGSSDTGSDFSVHVLGSDFATDAAAALLTPADREDWHDCLPDLSAPAEADDFTDLENRRPRRRQVLPWCAQPHLLLSPFTVLHPVLSAFGAANS
jgi:hypothetical protein